jgi:DNA repair protein RadC
MVMLLDAKNRVLGIDMVGAGGVDSAVVDLRLVFQAAIMLAVSAIIIAHNHPSGESTPSPEDIGITERIVKASKILNIRVLDHVVLGRDAYFSFLDAGLLPA